MAVLDGASVFGPAAVDTASYVDQLAAELAESLTDAERDLPSVLSQAVAEVAAQLHLEPGRSPSSTVLLARRRAGNVEVLALGDSTAVVQTADGRQYRITDNRLDAVAPDIRREYADRLRSGAGYDEQHRHLLRRLQEQECAARNRAGGYWIAEATELPPEVGVTRQFPEAGLLWVVLVTDGAQRVIDRLGIPWSEVAAMSADQLADLLSDLRRWEAEQDPSGVLLPRAKRHDDMTVVVWTTEQ